jgi:hypothetical protein
LFIATSFKIYTKYMEQKTKIAKLNNAPQQVLNLVSPFRLKPIFSPNMSTEENLFPIYSGQDGYFFFTILNSDNG